MKERMSFSLATVPALSPARALADTSKFPKKQLWGGFIIGIVVVLLGFFFLVCFKKRCFGIFKHRRRQNDILQREKIELRRFRLEELEKATGHFSEECMVGSGAFGKVYKGTLEADGTFAIKRAHADSYQSVQEFRNEVELLSRVKHKNLVALVGFCDEAGQKLLVYEFVPNGSLLEYIMARRGTPLTWMERVNIAIGAAKGISHLHEGVKPSIIHRDIKPSNILVGDEFEAKVSDFGLVKSGPVGDESHVSSQVKGTPGYLDPAYCSSLHLSPFSDVYSFGVILLQLVTARPAVDTSRNIAPLHISGWARPSLEKGIVEDVLDANLMIDSCNKKMMLMMGQLGLRCVVKVPKERPTMTQVWQELEESLYSTQNMVYKQPSRIPQRTVEHDESQSFMSMEGVKLQRFHVEMEGLSFDSINMRCLENNSISVDIDKHNLRTLREEDDSDYKSYMRN